MPVSYLFVVDQEGREVDRIEYDAGASSPAVQAVVSALGVSEDEARELVKTKNPGAELSSEEHAHELAEKIAGKSVEDRDPGSYGVEDSVLTVQENNPTPAVVMSLVQIPADASTPAAPADAVPFLEVPDEAVADESTKAEG